MAFLDKNKLKKKAAAAVVKEHPLLSEISLDDATKAAYVQGCVLACLVDDGVISAAESDCVYGVGRSLRMSESDIAECVETVSGLQNEEEKSQFVDELLSLLKPEPIGRYFMTDFESVMKVQGKINGDAAEILDYFGAIIFADEHWQEKRAQEKKRLQAAVAKAKADKEAAEKKAQEIEREKQRKLKAEEAAQRRLEDLRSYAAKCVDRYKKQFNRQIFSTIQTDVLNQNLVDEDAQRMFLEIGRHMIRRIDALQLPEMEVSRAFMKASRRKDGRELSSEDISKIESANNVVRETVWMLVAWCSKFVSPEKLSVKHAKDLVSRAFWVDLRDPTNLAHFWGNDCGPMGGLGVVLGANVESLFCETVGVKSVWRSMFEITKEQMLKLREMEKIRKDVPLDYAHSIGVSRFCDNDALLSMLGYSITYSVE